MVSLSCKIISQTDIISVDTSVVTLPNNVAKLIVKDLIKLDGCQQELSITQLKLGKYEEIIYGKDTTILLLNQLNGNLKYIAEQTELKYKLSDDMLKKTNFQLKSEVRKNTFFSIGATIIAVVVPIIFLKK